LFTSKTLERVTAAPAPVPAAQGKRSHIKKLQPWLLRLGWAASLFLATWVGFKGFQRVPAHRVAEQELVQDLRLIENKRLYDLVDDIDFLRDLDNPDLFADDTRGS